jgi:hypothetical protein
MPREYTDWQGCGQDTAGAGYGARTTVNTDLRYRGELRRRLGYDNRRAMGGNGATTTYASGRIYIASFDDGTISVTRIT